MLFYQILRTLQCGETEELYYVYAKGHLDSMYTTISEAVQRADDQLGVVVNNKQQLICIGIGAAMGIPSYFLLRNVMGNSNAATVMVLLMLPEFLFAFPF